MINIEENKKEFIETLLATQRPGIEQVIEKIEKWGFFKAPASTIFHLCEEGGLVQHSLNVYHMATKLKSVVVFEKPELESRLPDDQIAIAALLHDICKSDVYKPAIKRKKLPNGTWIDAAGYDVDYSGFPMGHGEKSVIMLLRFGFNLTPDEMLAIRWHMGPWDLPFQSNEEKSSLNAAKDKCPLLSLIMAADGLAASLIETDFNKA